MAGFPLGYPVLGALAGAAWVLSLDGSDRMARNAAGLGFLVGVGMGMLKMSSAGDVSGLGRVHVNPPGRAPWNPPRRYV